GEDAIYSARIGLDYRARAVMRRSHRLVQWPYRRQVIELPGRQVAPLRHYQRLARLGRLPVSAPISTYVLFTRLPCHTGVSEMLPLTFDTLILAPPPFNAALQRNGRDTSSCIHPPQRSSIIRPIGSGYRVGNGLWYGEWYGDHENHD